jgi:hypothetical protein
VALSAFGHEHIAIARSTITRFAGGALATATVLVAGSALSYYSSRAGLRYVTTSLTETKYGYKRGSI